MPEYLSPGVYVEEIDRGPKPIEGVGTAMACFVGFTEKAHMLEVVDGETVTRDLFNRPQLVTNWSQYVERFGAFVQGAYLPQAVYGYFQNGGSRCYVLSVKTIPRAQATLLNSEGKTGLLVRAKQAGFDGLRLRVRIDAPQLAAPAAPEKGKGKTKDAAEGEAPAVVATADAGTPPFTVTVEREKVAGGWAVQETLSDVSLTEVETENGAKHIGVAYKENRRPQFIDLVVPEGNTLPLAKLWPREQQQSLNIENRLLAAPTTGDFQGEILERTGIEGLEAIDDITIVVVPDLMTVMPGQKLDLATVKSVQTMIIAHCERLGDRVAILDAPPNLSPQAVKKWRMDIAGYDSSYATLYYPWIEVNDPTTNRPMLVPPAGHMAGVWARSDNTRGVHKAPANEVVRGATGLAYNVTKGEQDTLNPIGVNCVRAFPGMGIRVWGARTLSSNPSWRYINVRRLWGRIRRDVTAFMTMVWRDGALFGSAPSEAFFVKCDGETNPTASRDLGRLVIEIGMAPVKPAEFVIFRIFQWAPGQD